MKLPELENKHITTRSFVLCLGDDKRNLTCVNIKTTCQFETIRPDFPSEVDGF